MNKYFLAVIVLIIGATATAQSPMRTVLYTFEPGETLKNDEYCSNLKVLPNKFACITYNAVDSTMSLIINGERITTGNAVDALYLDTENPANSIYLYGNKGKKFIYVQGEHFGPYEDIYSESHYYFYPEHPWDNTPNLDFLFNKKRFYFKNMGMLFRHDNDGTIYMCNDVAPWAHINEKEQENPVFKSTNGKCGIEFVGEYYTFKFTGPGASWLVPVPPQFDGWKMFRLDNVVIANHGIAVLEYTYANESSDYPYKSYSFLYDLSTQSATGFSEDEYYDPATNSIKEKSARPRRPIRPEQFNNHIEKLSLQDKSKKHQFLCNYEYDYVMIDGNRYGNSVPVKAFYDEESDSFVWACVEDRNLVLYSYSLSGK